MGSKKKKDQNQVRPPMTPEAREEMLISLAEDNVERMLRDGTASSQIIAIYAKQGTRSAKLEREIAELNKELIAAKRDSLRQAQHLDELFAEATRAMKRYQGNFDDEE